jgi:DNA polymerase III subunit alpha
VVDPDDEIFDMPELSGPAGAPAVFDSAFTMPEEHMAAPGVDDRNDPIPSMSGQASGIIEKLSADWEDMPPPPPEPDDWHLMPPPSARVEDLLPRKVEAQPAPVKMIKEPDLILESVSVPQPETVVETLPLEVSYIVAPMQDDAVAIDQPSRMLQVVIQTTGMKEKDVLRMKRVYGILRSSPGKDHFSFMLYEGSHQFLVEFPNETTMISDDMMGKLAQLVGLENIQLVN